MERKSSTKTTLPPKPNKARNPRPTLAPIIVECSPSLRLGPQKLAETQGKPLATQAYQFRACKEQRWSPSRQSTTPPTRRIQQWVIFPLKRVPSFAVHCQLSPSKNDTEDNEPTVVAQMGHSQRRLGDSMLRAPIDSDFVLSRADRGSKEARRRPVQYENDHCIDEDKTSTPYKGITRMAPDTPTSGVHRCAIVDEHGFVRVNNFETRKKRAEPHRFQLVEECRGVESAHRRFPKTFQAPATPRMLPPREIPPSLLADFNRIATGWDAIVPDHTERKLEEGVSQAKSAYRRAQRTANTPANVNVMHRSRVSLRFTPQEYTPIAQRVIAEGFQIRFPPNGKPIIVRPVERTPADWGFDNHRFIEEAIRVDWPDKQMIDFWKFGVADLSSSTPPISTFIDASPSALLDSVKFNDKIAEESKLGWFGPPSARPEFVPHQSPPGALVPKKSSTKLRLVWNASNPRPDQANGLVYIQN